MGCGRPWFFDVHMLAKVETKSVHLVGSSSCDILSPRGWSTVEKTALQPSQNTILCQKSCQAWHQAERKAHLPYPALTL